MIVRLVIATVLARVRPAMANWSCEPQTIDALESLAAGGLLQASGNEPVHYRYQPVSAELEGMVGRLAALYSKHLVPVTNLVHSKPKTRVQEFADAFKFRKSD